MEKNIVFFDGLCLLCNRFVLFLIKLDTREVLYFSSLQGETVKKLLLNGDDEGKSRETIIFYKEGKVFYRSEAIMEIFFTVRPGWRVMRLFLLIPKTVRDFLYNMVAMLRYTLFGKLKQCFIPDEKLANRFLV